MIKKKKLWKYQSFRSSFTHWFDSHDMSCCFQASALVCVHQDTNRNHLGQCVCITTYRCTFPLCLQYTCDRGQYADCNLDMRVNMLKQKTMQVSHLRKESTAKCLLCQTSVQPARSVHEYQNPQNTVWRGLHANILTQIWRQECCALGRLQTVHRNSMPGSSIKMSMKNNAPIAEKPKMCCVCVCVAQCDCNCVQVPLM